MRLGWQQIAFIVERNYPIVISTFPPGAVSFGVKACPDGLNRRLPGYPEERRQTGPAGPVRARFRECYENRGHLWERYRQEVCGPRARLHRAEQMLDGVVALAHARGALSRRLCASSSICSCFQREIRRSMPLAASFEWAVSAEISPIAARPPQSGGSAACGNHQRHQFRCLCEGVAPGQNLVLAEATASADSQRNESHPGLAQRELFGVWRLDHAKRA